MIANIAIILVAAVFLAAPVCYVWERLERAQNRRAAADAAEFAEFMRGRR